MIDQYVRASCRGGQSGSPGLQTWSKSDGLTAEEEAELACVTDYRWARAVLLGNKPFETLPTAFGFRRLRSGRLTLFQSRPVPTDHVGRPGSYIAQAFVFAQELRPQLGSPVRYWRSTSFRAPLTDAEVQATTCPSLLEPLAPHQLEASPDDIERRFAEFIRERGANKLAELLGLGAIDPTTRRGPIVVAGPTEYVLLAVLARERYRREPIFFLTFVTDSGFNSDTNGSLTYEVCGEFGSHELARLWRDTHGAWLFEWDAPPLPDTVAPDYLEDFVAAGGNLEHHDYFGPDEGPESIPKIDDWLKWRERVSTLRSGSAEQLTRYAATSRNSKLRTLAIERIATTLGRSLALVPDGALATLVARTAQDDSISPTDDRTLGFVAAIVEGLCNELNTTPDALGEALKALRGTRLGHAVRRALTYRLLLHTQNALPICDPALDHAPAVTTTPASYDPLVAARLVAVAVGLGDFDRNVDERRAFNRLLYDLIVQSGTGWVLFDLSYAAADDRILPALCQACQEHPRAFGTLAKQLANWCERAFGAGERKEVVCHWLLTAKDRALVSQALAGVLENIRLKPAQLRVVLDIARTSGLDETGELSRDLIRACAAGELNTTPVHLRVILEGARANDALDARFEALQLAEERSSSIALMRADWRGPLLRQVHEALERLRNWVEVPRLRALLWIHWVGDAPRRMSVSGARAHVAAIGLLDETARKQLLSEIIRAALCVPPHGERRIYVALECLREFGRDRAAEGLLSQMLDAPGQPDFEAQLDTLVARADRRTSMQIVPFVDDQILGSWLVRNQTLRRHFNKSLRRLGFERCDESFVRMVNMILEVADRQARGWR